MPKQSILRGVMRLSLVCLSLILLFEISVRLFWTALPHELRLAIVGVRLLPWSEQTLDLTTFRADETVTQTEPLDILIVGDSFAFCWLDSEDCWAAHLSAHGWRALSAASLGSGSQVQLETLRRLLSNLEPRLIIWQWYYNDADDNCRLAQGNAAASAHIAPEAAPVIGSGLGQYSALARMVGNWLRWRAFTPPPPPPPPVTRPSEAPCEGDMASVLNDYDAGIALAAQHKAAVIIALVPYIDEIEGAQDSDSPIEKARQFRRMLLAHCAVHGYHCVDPTDVLREAYQAGQPTYNRADLHLTAYANRLFAETLIAYIERHNLLAVP